MRGNSPSLSYEDFTGCLFTKMVPGWNNSPACRYPWTPSLYVDVVDRIRFQYVLLLYHLPGIRASSPRRIKVHANQCPHLINNKFNNYECLFKWTSEWITFAHDVLCILEGRRQLYITVHYTYFAFSIRYKSNRNDSLALSVVKLIWHVHESHLTNRTFPGLNLTMPGAAAGSGPTLLAVLCDHSDPVHHRDPGSQEVTVWLTDWYLVSVIILDGG